MAAPKGNDFYKLADWGKPASYEPIALWDKFRDYVNEINTNPWSNKIDPSKIGQYWQYILTPLTKQYILNKQ